MGMNIEDLKVISPAFDFGQPIPKRHASDGENINPELTWSGVPDGTQEIAVVCHDPDAPLPDGYTHWVVYGIPPEVTRIPEQGGNEFTEGVTESGGTGYEGPAPPPGHGPHHYYFWVYCLDQRLDAQPGLSRQKLLDLMEGHIIEQNRTVGTYEN